LSWRVALKIKTQNNARASAHRGVVFGFQLGDGGGEREVQRAGRGPQLLRAAGELLHCRGSGVALLAVRAALRTRQVVRVPLRDLMQTRTE
jgi:hypothetical protein